MISAAVNLPSMRREKFVAVPAIAVLLSASTFPEPIYAQTSPPSTEAPMTGIKPDRTVADKTSRRAMREKEAALKQKRSECRKQAKIQKVSLLKRQRFIHECMSR
jgi:ribosomal protein S8E